MFQVKNLDAQITHYSSPPNTLKCCLICSFAGMKLRMKRRVSVDHKKGNETCTKYLIGRFLWNTLNVGVLLV
jgi:hypothetical protein